MRGGRPDAPANAILWSRLDVAGTFCARLLGLMPDAWRARRASAAGAVLDGMPRALLFPRCAAVHTCGMAMPVDVAFLDGHGVVVASFRAVEPWRFLRVRGARFAVERLACGSPWLDAGEHVPGLRERAGFSAGGG